jgi:hypothetical protein
LAETGDNLVAYMIVAPTMRVSMVLTNSVNAYLARSSIPIGVVEAKM